MTGSCAADRNLMKSVQFYLKQMHIIGYKLCNISHKIKHNTMSTKSIITKNLTNLIDLLCSLKYWLSIFAVLGVQFIRPSCSLVISFTRLNTSSSSAVFTEAHTGSNQRSQTLAENSAAIWPMQWVCNITRKSVHHLLSLLLLSSIISMMKRLLHDVSICFCPTSEQLLVVQSTSLLLYLHLHCPSISSVVFLGFFSHWYSCSVMLSLAAVRFPFLIHARTNLVFALLFCQPVSLLDTEYHAQSHFSSYHVLLLLTIFWTMSFLLWGFVFHLLSSSANILNRTAALELRRFYTASLLHFGLCFSVQLPWPGNYSLSNVLMGETV